MLRQRRNIIALLGLLGGALYSGVYSLTIITGTWRTLAVPGLILLHILYTALSLFIIQKRLPARGWTPAFITASITGSIALAIVYCCISLHVSYWVVNDLIYLGAFIFLGMIISAIVALLFIKKKTYRTNQLLDDPNSLN